jgi:hypothetical protein
MNNAKVNKRVLIAVTLIGVLVVAVGLVSALWGPDASGQNSDASDHSKVRDALRRGGLREAARIKGRYVASTDVHWDFGQFDVETLTKNSTAVIVGVPRRTLGGRLSADGQTILTDYEVSVSERIKGAMPQGSTITVSLPGGLVKFEDGTSAELKTPEFDHFKTGATYTLFLSETENAYNVFTLSGGPQGMVEIVNDTTLKSHGRPTDPVSKEVKVKGKEAFLEDVRGKAAKWPQPGKCCS